jgi:hypothetical protein
MFSLIWNKKIEVKLDKLIGLFISLISFFLFLLIKLKSQIKRPSSDKNAIKFLPLSCIAS